MVAIRPPHFHEFNFHFHLFIVLSGALQLANSSNASSKFNNLTIQFTFDCMYVCIDLYIICSNTLAGNTATQWKWQPQTYKQRVSPHISSASYRNLSPAFCCLLAGLATHICANTYTRRLTVAPCQQLSLMAAHNKWLCLYALALIQVLANLFRNKYDSFRVSLQSICPLICRYFAATNSITRFDRLPLQAPNVCGCAEQQLSASYNCICSRADGVLAAPTPANWMYLQHNC